MSAPFVLVSARRPASLGSKGRQLFQASFRAEAEGRFAGREPLQGDLYVRIVWFHRTPTTQDVDNIAKNILDALKGVAFADDVAVVQCLTYKVDTSRPYVLVQEEAPDPAALDELNALLGEENVLYVEVGIASARRVHFGPIEGGLI